MPMKGATRMKYNTRASGIAARAIRLPRRKMYTPGHMMANSEPSVRPRLYFATDGQTVMTVVSLNSAGTTPAIGCTSEGAVAVDMRGAGSRFHVQASGKKVAEQAAAIQRSARTHTGQKIVERQKRA